MTRGHAAQGRSFDPEKRGSWRGSSRDLVVNRRMQRNAGSLEIEIPTFDPDRWKQIGGDMNPAQHGGLLAKADGNHIELLEIQSVRDLVGDGEAVDVGFPFWTKEAWYDLSDLDPSKKEVQSALSYVGLDMHELGELKPHQRALAIAEALMRYGHGVDEGTAGWSKDIIHEDVEWWGGTVEGSSYIADEDDEFRREVLGEDEDSEEDEED